MVAMVDKMISNLTHHRISCKIRDGVKKRPGKSLGFPQTFIYHTVSWKTRHTSSDPRILESYEYHLQVHLRQTSLLAVLSLSTPMELIFSWSFRTRLESRSISSFLLDLIPQCVSQGGLIYEQVDTKSLMAQTHTMSLLLLMQIIQGSSAECFSNSQSENLMCFVVVFNDQYHALISICTT